MPFTRLVARRIHTFLRSDSFFYLTLALLVVSACYIAATSIFPMAFDEEFHFGLIKIYASNWLPYGIEHTSDMAVYGPATADASYLFHYLMSFPYRLFAGVGFSQDGVIIMLRLLNVAMVAGAMVVFRRALLEAGFARGSSNVALALVTSLPVFILLAAHINYDNLLLLLVAWCVLLLVRITNRSLQNQPIRLIDTWLLGIALLVGMSIKYAFLPLGLVLAVWAAYYVLGPLRSPAFSFQLFRRALTAQWKDLPRTNRYLLGSLSVISIFFAAHYVTNTLSYGSPIPACDQVFSETECQAYGPWNRNRYYQATKPKDFQPVSYPRYMIQEWFPGMAQRLTFAVAGKTNDFQTKLPLPFVVYGYSTLSVIGLLCLVIQAARKKLPWLSVFTILLSLIYAGILSLQLYGDYRSTGQPVAINGRYLLPLLPLVSVSLIHAMRQTFQRVPSSVLAGMTATVFMYLVISGAGISTYIVLSEAHWYWPGFAQVLHVQLQAIAERLVVPIRFKP